MQGGAKCRLHCPALMCLHTGTAALEHIALDLHRLPPVWAWAELGLSARPKAHGQIWQGRPPEEWPHLFEPSLCFLRQYEQAHAILDLYARPA